MRRWMPDPAGLLEVWRHEAPRTLRVAASFSDSDLPYRLGPGARSVGELLAYLADSYRLTRHWLTSDRPPAAIESRPLRSVRHGLAALTAGQNELFAALSDLPASRFFDTIAPFGMTEPRGVMALGMFKHDLHYRGELYALAVACGHPPPDLYAPPNPTPGDAEQPAAVVHPVSRTT